MVFFLVLGVGFAVLLAVVNALWYEARMDNNNIKDEN